MKMQHGVRVIKHHLKQGNQVAAIRVALLLLNRKVNRRLERHDGVRGLEPYTFHDAPAYVAEG